MMQGSVRRYIRVTAIRVLDVPVEIALLSSGTGIVRDPLVTVRINIPTPPTSRRVRQPVPAFRRDIRARAAPGEQAPGVLRRPPAGFLAHPETSIRTPRVESSG